MTRVKPTPIVPTLDSIEAVDAALAQIAARKRTIALIEAGMNEEVDRIKLAAAAECAPHKQDVAGLEQAILRYADANRATLFATRKSAKLTFGEIGYRASTSLKTLAKWTWERVLQALRDKEAYAFIRVKEEVDKEALKGLAPESLAEVGVKAVQADTFYYELEEQDISTTSNGQAA